MEVYYARHTVCATAHILYIYIYGSSPTSVRKRLEAGRGVFRESRAEKMVHTAPRRQQRHTVGLFQGAEYY